MHKAKPIAFPLILPVKGTPFWTAIPVPIRDLFRSIPSFRCHTKANFGGSRLFHFKWLTLGLKDGIPSGVHEYIACFYAFLAWRMFQLYFLRHDRQWAICSRAYRSPQAGVVDADRQMDVGVRHQILYSL